jgi:RNA polymerase sigma-70 factor (ECF subfamily)
MTPDVLEPERAYLRGVAYRLLGSAADADDVVQEAMVKARAIDDADVRSPRALLTTIVTRLCLDEVRSARRRRERYVGPWLPEPVVTGALGAATGDRPDDKIGATESVSVAFLLLLETLTPHERAVFVLREVLDLEFAEIAAAVDKTEAACRQLLHRARERVAAGRRRFPRRDAQAALATRFVTALATGDVAALVDLLIDDATAVSDHGGKAKAAQHTIVGADRVARFLVGMAGKAATLQLTSEVAWLNGSPALVVRDARAGAIYVTVTLDLLEVDGAARVAAVHLVRNPDKLPAALPAID